MAGKKLAVGVFSFTGDEGCMIVFEEMLNTHFFEWSDFMEFRTARILQAKSEIRGLDVALIEGAIANEAERKRAEEIRANSKRVVAVGSCAISGSPSNHRNFFDEERLKEIEPIVTKFHHLPKVQSLKETIKVDAEVPGCPMMEDKLIEVLNNYLIEFGIVKKGNKKRSRKGAKK